tara:strand:- start:261 stop:503 length:243 start_codon:yes stop_codon:yes gene_type:complete
VALLPAWLACVVAVEALSDAAVALFRAFVALVAAVEALDAAAFFEPSASVALVAAWLADVLASPAFVVAVFAWVVAVEAD